MVNRLKLVLCTLIFTALISAGISPACDFIAGKMTMIEICTEDGTIKTIAVADEQTPKQDHKHAHKNKDCAFCFSNAQGKDLASNTTLHHPLINGQMKTGEGSAEFVSLSLKSFESTGPPTILHS